MPRCQLCGCNLHGACGGKVANFDYSTATDAALQSARGVWRQRPHRGREARTVLVAICTGRVEAKASYIVVMLVKFVAICTGRVEDLASSPEKNLRKFMQTYCIFIHLGV